VALNELAKFFGDQVGRAIDGVPCARAGAAPLQRGHPLECRAARRRRRRRRGKKIFLAKKSTRAGVVIAVHTAFRSICIKKVCNMAFSMLNFGFFC
jgi:hypothetical protein